jgi:hypothetical protein
MKQAAVVFVELLPIQLIKLMTHLQTVSPMLRQDGIKLYVIMHDVVLQDVGELMRDVVRVQGQDEVGEDVDVVEELLQKIMKVIMIVVSLVEQEQDVDVVEGQSQDEEGEEGQLQDEVGEDVDVVEELLQKIMKVIMKVVSLVEQEQDVNVVEEQVQNMTSAIREL